MDHKQLFRSDGILGITALIWGLAFVAQKEGMEHIGPFTFNAIRFSIGALALVPILYLRRNKNLVSKESGKITLLQAGLITGLLLFLGASFQQIGIKYTTAGNAGFITTLYVIFTPILGIFVGMFPKIKVWIGAILATVGLYFLTITESFSIQTGDLLVLICALFFAIHVLVIGWLSPKFSSNKLAQLQFAVAGILSFAGVFVTESLVWENIYAAALPLLYVGILSTAIAFTFQIIGQKHAPPTHAAIILSFEAVFAVLGGWLLLDENLSDRNIIGCVLMFAGIIVAQLRYKDFRSKTQVSGHKT